MLLAIPNGQNIQLFCWVFRTVTTTLICPLLSSNGNSCRDTDTLHHVHIQDIPIQDIHIQDVPIQDMPIQDIPIQDIPIQDIPIQDGPVQDIPIQDIPWEGRIVCHLCI